ncbi:MAG: PilC/PilY family type IV pilus protein [Rhodoferax sp.]|nr:PilC/PilY family type IV pilus protein [Rhodoferax sp.]MDP3653891.1 PilC/PilY family type IV pilus protein [Rhodoferax sp.]
MQKNDILGQFKVSCVGVACMTVIALAQTSYATPLDLSQVPAGNGGIAPAPNVIITVDDSGSMGWDLATDQETANVANRKITLLKNSLKAQFGNGTANSGKTPDKRIRLAWQAMHNNGGAPGAGSLTAGAINSMRSFEGSHRVNFNTFVDGLVANNGTPSLKMMRNAHNYMRSAAGTNSPWADAPGTAQVTPYLACRRTYHVFLTDGAWNSQSNTNDKVALGDSKNRTLPDSTSYSTGSTPSRVYTDSYGDTNTTYASTFSDFAFNSWATDLQNGSNSTQAMANTVKPLIKKSGAETFATTACTNAGNCTATQEYWNPKNDPATWQHINTYTIGFGVGAVNWPSTANTPVDWDDLVTPNPSGDNYGGDFPKLVQGAKVWPDVAPWDSAHTPAIRTIELWHGALNGRGKYYPVKTADGLTAAFADIMDTVIADTSTPLVSIATSSNYLRTGLNAYIAGYSSLRYSGSLSARPLDGMTGAVQATEAWNAVSLLDAISTANLSNRVVLSYSGTAGIPWKTWSSLPTAQQTPLNQNSAGTVDSNGQNRVDYIRGNRTKELAQQGGIFRDRDSRFGDVVNSNIWYTGKPNSGYSTTGYATFRSTGIGGQGGRTPMLYIGANDGMLHGFVAANWPSDASITHAGGKELLAYIPQGIAQGNLRKLTDTTYSHLYFVDGSPFTGDAYIGGTPAWKTVLVGTLGAGGKGYFVLDVTNPANFSESNAASLVMMDTTATADIDIGNITSLPVMDESFSNKSRQIVKMNGGRWAAVLGNGYNSTSEAPVLLVQYLDGDKSIKKISPCALPTSGTCSFKGSNGLSAPQLIDLNGDGTMDIAYAGDIKGNLWKFDLTSATDSDWKVSFAGQPFFVAKQSTAQSFTSTPFWGAHPKGGIMVAIGTGQNLTTNDQSDTATVQSIYALWDNSTYTNGATVSITDTTPINTVADAALPTTLVQQTVSSAAQVDSTSINYYESSTNTVDYSTKRGWYLNWSLPGQRVIQNIRAFSGEKILISSLIPKSGGASNGETCSASATAERSFLTVLDLMSGNPPTTPAFKFEDINLSNIHTTTIEGKAGDSAVLRINNTIKVISSSCPVGQTCGCQVGEDCGSHTRDVLDLDLGRIQSKRANWRQTQ